MKKRQPCDAVEACAAERQGRDLASPEYKSLLQKAILGGKISLVYQAGNGLAVVPTQLYRIKTLHNIRCANPGRSSLEGG